jgi:hypothetical protein
MSFNFDGVDDLVIRDASVTLGAIISVSAWIKPDTFGENDSGAVWQQDSQSDVSRLALRILDNKLGVTAKGFGFGAARSTTDGRWSSPINVIVPGAWHHLAATYDGSSTANNAQLYLNGLAVTTTRSLAPVGTLNADNKLIHIGNNGPIAARTFDGLIGEVAHWMRLLSAEEIAAVYLLGVNAVPDYGDYTPFDSGRSQAFGAGTYTVTGALAGENPPVQPAGRCG